MRHNDAVMWAIERDPQLRSTITAIMLLDRAPDVARIQQRLEALVAEVPRLRQHVANPLLGVGVPRWVDDDDFDLRYHLRTIAAPLRADPRWLMDYAASMAEAAFDRDRPLWEFVVVEGLADGRAALVQKVHHALTDGIGGVQLMIGLLDQTRNGRPAAARSRATAGVAPVAGDPAARVDRGRAWPALRALPVLPGWARTLVVHPMSAATTTWNTATSIRRFLSPGGRQLSPVLRGRSIGWRFDSLELPVADLHQAGEAAQGTINDAFLAAVAGGLRRYHLAHGANVEQLRITLPISLRTAHDTPGSNRFTPVRFALPVGEEDPVARIRQIGALCRRWRHEEALPFTDAIAGALNRLHPVVTTAVMSSLLKGIDVVATNVPGVPFRCYLGGAEVLRHYGLAPLTGAAVNVALLTHAGTACIGINTDRAAVADPEFLVCCLQDGFDELRELAEQSRRRAS